MCGAATVVVAATAIIAATSATIAAIARSESWQLATASLVARAAGLSAVSDPASAQVHA